MLALLLDVGESRSSQAFALLEEDIDPLDEVIEEDGGRVPEPCTFGGGTKGMKSVVVMGIMRVSGQI